VPLTASKFQVKAATSTSAPYVQMTPLGWDRLRFGALSVAYLDLSNPTESDYQQVPVRITIPNDVGPTTMVVPVDATPLVAGLQASGVSANLVDAARAGFTSERDSTPTIDANGNQVFATFLPMLRAHGRATIRFEFSNFPPPATPMMAAASVTANTATQSCQGSTSERGSAESTANSSDSPHHFEDFAEAVKSAGRQALTDAGKQVLPDNQYTKEGIDAAAWAIAGAAWKYGIEPQLAKVSEWVKAGYDDAANELNQISDDLNALSEEWTAAQSLNEAIGDEAAAEEAAYAASEAAVEAGEAAAAAAEMTEMGALLGTILAPDLAAIALFLVGMYALGKLAVGLIVAAAESCDPNELIGPGTNGGPLTAGSTANYQVEFENVGPLAAKTVAVTVPLSPQLDPKSFQLSGVRIGGTDIAMSRDLTDPTQEHGRATLNVRGTSTPVTVDSKFDGTTLTVHYGGPPNWNDPFNPGLPSDILPANTTPPEGEGSFEFSAQLKNLPLTTPVVQDPASIVFDNNNPISTMNWTNTIAFAGPATDHPLSGTQLVLTDNPTLPASKTIKLEVRDPSLDHIADPRVTGATLIVSSEAGFGSYALPASGWKAAPAFGVPRSYQYVSKVGPIRTVKVDVLNGRIKLSGKGSGLQQSLATTPTSVSVSFHFGGDRYCAEFDTPLTPPTVKRWQSRLQPQPRLCLN
jgi:hypothetical protein